jgi:hypothetical protein
MDKVGEQERRIQNVSHRASHTNSVIQQVMWTPPKERFSTTLIFHISDYSVSQ